MARNGNHAPEFRPLDRARAEQLTLLVDKAARSDAILIIDPDTGQARDVMPNDNLNPEDPVGGIHRFTVHSKHQD